MGAQQIQNAPQMGARLPNLESLTRTTAARPVLVNLFEIHTVPAFLGLRLHEEVQATDLYDLGS